MIIFFFFPSTAVIIIIINCKWCGVPYKVFIINRYYRLQSRRLEKHVKYVMVEYFSITRIVILLLLFVTRWLMFMWQCAMKINLMIVEGKELITKYGELICSFISISYCCSDLCPDYSLHNELMTKLVNNLYCPYYLRPHWTGSV